MAQYYPTVRAPELIGVEADWINSKPLSIKSLRGKVVLVDFWEYTCVNCIRTMPYLKEWWNRYKDKGLVIVGIHTPEFDFAGNTKNVADAVKGFGLDYPVIIDSHYKNWQAWSNKCWPNKLLVDKDGKVVYEHAGEGGYGNTEAEIQKLLRQIDPNVKLPEIMEPVRPADKPGAVCYPATPEMYAGHQGFENGQYGSAQFGEGKTFDYNKPDTIEEGKFYAIGKWETDPEFLQAKSDHSSLIIDYKAKEANAVLKTAGKEVTVEILQDGKPIAKADAGRDVTFENGHSFIKVTQPRMYSLTVNHKWGEHQLELRPKTTDFQIFSFTFSSDCEG